MGILSHTAILGIRVYQWTLRPLLATFLGISIECRFYPSCSHYSKQAIQSHGLFKGCLLTLIRLAKCQPWHSGGYDPIPSPFDTSHPLHKK